MSNFKTLRRTLAGGILCAVVASAPLVAAEPVEIVAFGDSLTAGFGLDPGRSFPEQLEAALKTRGHNVTVTNAGVSGDTASDGLARLEWSVPSEADIVIVELGANDALRGIDPAVTRKALSDVLAKLADRGQAILLAGMLAPINLGPTYAKSFNPIYPELAEQYDVPLYPFFLAGIATNPSLNLPDGMHPNGDGVAKIVEAMLPEIEALVVAAGEND
jgi:acyl-CoA thioesterase I